MATCRQMRKRRVTGFFWGFAGVMPRHVKRSEKKKLTRKFGRVTFYTWGIYVSSCFLFFFQLVGVNSLGGRNLAISGVAMKLTPQEKWKILPIVEQLGEPPTIGIRQLKGDSALSGCTAIHNHQTTTKTMERPNVKCSQVSIPFQICVL